MFNKKLKITNDSEKKDKKKYIQNDDPVKLIDEWAKGDGTCLDLTEYLNKNEWEQWARNQKHKFDISNMLYLPEKW